MTRILWISKYEMCGSALGELRRAFDNVNIVQLADVSPMISRKENINAIFSKVDSDKCDMIAGPFSIDVLYKMLGRRRNEIILRPVYKPGQWQLDTNNDNLFQRWERVVKVNIATESI